MGARNRGWLSGLTMPMMSIGVLLVYTMGSWLPWHYTAAICTLVPLCLLAALSPYFDSPYWYFSIGKEKNAHMAIEQFRGPATNVVSEIFTIQQHVESSQSEEDISFLSALIKVFTERIYFSTNDTTDWFPIISMLIYMLAAPLGLCSIPFLYIAEFFPSELRSVLAGLTTMLTNITMAVAIKTFTNLDSLLGHHGLVWFYSAACFGAILLTLSYVPETKDKSLTVINDKFAKLRKTVRASPWVTPLPSPSVNSVRKFQYKSQMFTQ